MKSSYRPYLFSCILVCLFLPPATSWSWQGKVVNVVNGDTIEILHDGKRETIRLYGIMVPVERQAFSREAKKFTSEKVMGKTVSVKPIEKSPSGAIAATLVFERVNLNVELVRAGYAWVYDQSCTRPECKAWKFIEAKARDEQNGLWSLPAPIPPWEYREAGSSEANGPKRQRTAAQSMIAPLDRRLFFLNPSFCSHTAFKNLHIPAAAMTHFTGKCRGSRHPRVSRAFSHVL